MAYNDCANFNSWWHPVQKGVTTQNIFRQTPLKPWSPEGSVVPARISSPAWRAREVWKCAEPPWRRLGGTCHFQGSPSRDRPTQIPEIPSSPYRYKHYYCVRRTKSPIFGLRGQIVGNRAPPTSAQPEAYGEAYQDCEGFTGKHAFRSALTPGTPY